MAYDKSKDESEFRLLRKEEVLEAYVCVLVNSKGVPNWVKYTYGERMINQLEEITDRLSTANAIQWTNRSKAVSLAREASFIFDNFKRLSDKFLNLGSVRMPKDETEDANFDRALAALRDWSGIRFTVKRNQKEYFSWLRTDFGKSLGCWLKNIQQAA